MEEWICKMKEEREFYATFALANSCIPTLLKQKPSSLITVHKKYMNSRKKFFEEIKKEITYFQVDYELLYESKDMYFLFIYDSRLLKQVLKGNQSNCILRKNGYMTSDFKQVLEKFKKRFQEYKEEKIEFPHEVGIFLGYPVEDVEGYILNKGENYKFCGYWKVYYNVEQAKRTFRFFTEVRDYAVNLLIAGRELKEIRNYS